MQTMTPASNACISCASQKRKCDRLNPACGRCAKNNVPCQYSSCDGGMHVGYDRSNSRLGSGESSRLSLESLCWSHLPGTDTPAIDRYCTSHLFHILDRFSCELEDIVGCHFKCIHPWLPIIHPRSLTQRVPSLRQRPSAELASLVLNILLSNPPITAFMLDYTVVQDLYESCRFIFSLIQTFRRDSLCTLQSGLLLAVYEQGSGHLSNAYLTLATCASLGYAVGLYKLPNINTSHGEESKRVWWATYLLDRLVYYSDNTADRIPLTHSARVGDVLPINDDIWGEHTDAASWLSGVPRLSVTPTEMLGCFAQQIQAMSLLDRVVTLARDWPNRAGRLLNEDVWELDTAIQKTLQDTLNISGADWEPRYRAIVLLLLALLELHETASASLRHENIPPMFHDASIAAMETALNFTRDIVCMDDILNVERMPLAAVLLLSKAGAVAINLDFEHKCHTNVLEPVIGSLERASKRWAIAGRFVRELNMMRSQAPRSTSKQS